MPRFFLTALAFVATFLIALVIKVVHIPTHIGNFLKDHCQWVRRLIGGTWLQWNGFWEKANAQGSVIYRRGRVGINLMEGQVVWDFNQLLTIGDSVISQVEDYTKKS